MPPPCLANCKEHLERTTQHRRGIHLRRFAHLTRHLGIAYGSAVETGELLRLALETEILQEGSVRVLLKRVQETERLLLGMLKHRRKFLLKAPVHCSLFTVHAVLIPKANPQFPRGRDGV
jgi:four helix bundle protein